MPYRVEFTAGARKFLRTLRDEKLAQRLIRAAEALAEEPRPPGVKKLSGSENIHRIRVSDYRIVYEIHDGVLLVLVLSIGHRREVYR